MIAGIAIALAAHALFTTVQVVMPAASRSGLRERAAAGEMNAGTVLRMVEDPLGRAQGTALLGSSVALVAGTALTGMALSERGVPVPWAWAAAYLPIALFFGESLPRQLARPYADSLAPTLAPLLESLQGVAAPLLWLLSSLTSALQRALPPESDPIRREDIVQMLDDRKAHSIDAQDREFIRRLLALSEITAEEAMTPLVDVHAVAEHARVADAIQVVLDHSHSRLPVYRERIDNIVGRVELMDLLTAPDDDPLAGYVRPVPFVPDSKRADVLLREMRESRDSFAAVVDEYGGSVGIVTMEDLLEQVVGDIVDERDDQAPGIRRLGEQEWRVPARTPIEDLAAAIGRPVPLGDYETVAGLLLSVTGRIPQGGTQIRVDRLLFQVEAASERAVHLVRVWVAPD